MTLTLELSPDLEARLQAAAAQRGQEPAAFAAATLSEALQVRISNTTGAAHLDVALDHAQRVTMDELDAALDELEKIGAGIPGYDSSVTHSREDIYFDHD